MADEDLNTNPYLFNTPAGIAGLREKVSTTHDVMRIIRYGLNWQFYLGVHWNFTREDGEPLIMVNYLAALVDKKIAFLIGADWTLNVPPVLQRTTAPLIQKVWEENGRQRLNYDIVQEGAVTGDCFVLVTVAPPTIEQRKADPLRQYRIVIQRLNSHECFPEWDEDAPPTKYGRKMRSFTLLKFFRRQKPGGKDGETEDIKYTMKITDDVIQTKLGDNPVKEEDNILGEIPVVHILNKAAGRTFFGVDDCTDLISLNREYNEKSTDISDSINYNAAPITVITGAKAKSLERSPRAIWSNLPQGASVFHLKLEGDLTASVSYLERTKRAMHEIAGVPENSLGQMQPITGASGETLNMQMAPLVDERNKKKATYEPGFERVNYFILRYDEEFNNARLPIGLCERCGGKIAITYVDDPDDVTTAEEREAQIQAGARLATDIGPRKIEVRKCYLADPDTFSFLDPAKVKVPVVRMHSFGTELTKVTLAQAAAEHGLKNVSAYDVPDPMPLDEGIPGTPPSPTNPEGEEDIPPEAPPPIPQKLTKLPPEPETFDLPEVKVEYADGSSSVIVQQAKTGIQAVPVECDQHTFLSPYTNWVVFNDTLPKDKQGQADLLMKYQQMQVVSRAWMMAQIGIENPQEMLEQIQTETAATPSQGPPPTGSKGEAVPSASDTSSGNAEAGGPGSEPASTS